MISKGLAAGAVVLVSSAQLPAALVFPFNSGGQNRNIDYLDGYLGSQWSAYGKAEAGGSVTDYSSITPDGHTDSPRQVGLGFDYGVGGSSGTQGYLFAITDGANNYFTFTSTFAAQPISTSTVTWDMGNSLQTNVRLLIQVAGNWYSSETFYSANWKTLAQFQSSPTQFALELSQLKWYAYDMATLNVNTNSLVTLPGTEFTGVGFHTLSWDDNSVIRFDNLAIVPEPATALLATLGAPGLFRRRR